MEKYFIYKMNVLDEFYIGSTKNPSSRFYHHKFESKTNRNKDKKVYRKMNLVENYDNKDELNYEILECMECSSNDAKIREQYWIDTLKPTLNSIKAYSTPEDRKQRARDYQRKLREKESEFEHKLRLAKKKVWYLENREKILEKERIRYKDRKIRQLKEKMKQMEKTIEYLEDKNKMKFDDLEIDVEIDLEKVNLSEPITILV